MGNHHKMDLLFLYTNLYFYLFSIYTIALYFHQNAFVLESKIIIKEDGIFVLCCQEGSSQNGAQ